MTTSVRRWPMTNVGTSRRLGIGPRATCPDPPFPARVQEISTLQAALTVCRRCCASSLLVLVADLAWAGPPSDTLLPKTTKGYVSVAQPKQFDERWDKTQIGQMFNDDIMQPFVEDFRKQTQRGVRRGRSGSWGSRGTTWRACPPAR